jgi:desulfoferrodoxin (superoxide reductase-like protein)
LKKWCRLILGVGFLLALKGISAAHPPVSMDVALQPEGKLRVQVSHTVNDPAKHFINRIVVMKDGKVIAEQGFGQQADKTGQDVEIAVTGLAKGQTIQVEADCNIFGSLKKTFTL